ncbi:MAG: toll/interleukin-1 receptor domain-containing protein [Oscillospiraceae bacterium]|nr:toll/interleukin-1 receptor domain-containing protein [Oscillospiraceae bacterium]
MKVFIAYSHRDSAIAKSFYGYLREHGFEVSSDNDLLVGDSWQEKLLSMMSEADVVMVIVSNDSMKSVFVHTEIGMTIRSDKFRDIPRLFPYIVYGTDIPSNLEDIQCFIGTDNVYHDLELISEQLNELRGSILTKNKANYEQLGNIGVNLDTYIRDVFVRLDKNERRNRLLSYFMYFVAFMLLTFSLIFAFNTTKAYVLVTTLEEIIPKAISGTLIFAVAIAMARFAFLLGKSFMVEAIRNGDRIHAISFGQFFIKAYGDKATRQEVREVFGEWNIDKGSSFRTMEARDIDPNTLGALEIIKTAIAKK